jgi:hypothetical protein
MNLLAQTPRETSLPKIKHNGTSIARHKRTNSQKTMQTRTKQNTTKKPQKLLRRKTILQNTRPNRSNAPPTTQKTRNHNALHKRNTNSGEEECTCKTAKSVQEATQLIEAGFQYVTEIDEVKLFRKRK